MGTAFSTAFASVVSPLTCPGFCLNTGPSKQARWHHSQITSDVTRKRLLISLTHIVAMIASDCQELRLAIFNAYSEDLQNCFGLFDRDDYSSGTCYSGPEQ